MDQQGYGPGTVSIEVFQVINGNTVTSNHVDGFQIGDLPTVNLPAGQVTSTVLRAQSQSTMEMEGVLASADATSLAQHGTSRVRGLMDNLRQATAPVSAAISGVMSGGAPSQPLGEINGQALALDSNLLATTDRILAAVIMAQPPIDPLSQNMQRLSSASLFNAGTAKRRRRDNTNLPDCEIPDPPAGAELRGMLSGESPAISYTRDYQTCLDELAALQTIADFSNDLARAAQYADRKEKQVLAFLGLPLATSVADTPTSATAKLVEDVSAVASIPTYANLAGQSLAGVASLYYYFKTGADAQSTAAANVVQMNLQAQLSSESKDILLREAALNMGFEELQFKEPTTLGEAFSTWVSAAKDVTGESPEAQGEMYEPSVGPDGQGGNQLEPFSGIKTVAVWGTVSDPSTGMPESDAQIQACPPLPGQPSQAPRAEAPTYDDGSYTVMVPMDFTQNDSGVCKLVIYPQNGANSAAQQDGYVDLGNGPKIIDFPDDSPPGQVELRGQDSGTAVYAECGKTSQEGFISIDITLQNLSWLQLLRSGGSFSGFGNYQKVASVCSDGQITYNTTMVIQTPVSGMIEAGGQGQMTIGPVTYNITITDSTVQGMLTPDALTARCVDVTQCSFQLQLEVIR